MTQMNAKRFNISLDNLRASFAFIVSSVPANGKCVGENVRFNEKPDGSSISSSFFFALIALYFSTSSYRVPFKLIEKHKVS